MVHADGFGIAVYGTDAKTPITGLIHTFCGVLSLAVAGVVVVPTAEGKKPLIRLEETVLIMFDGI